MLSYQVSTQTGLLYCNYKACHSVGLFEVADANCCFTLTDDGAYGRQNDSSVLNNSSLAKEFTSGRLNIPQEGER
jgi:hypothetical protein